MVCLNFLLCAMCSGLENLHMKLVGSVLKVITATGHVIRFELKLLTTRLWCHTRVFVFVSEVLLNYVEGFVIDVTVFVRLQILDLIQTYKLKRIKDFPRRY